MSHSSSDSDSCCSNATYGLQEQTEGCVPSQTLDTYLMYLKIKMFAGKACTFFSAHKWQDWKIYKITTDFKPDVNLNTSSGFYGPQKVWKLKVEHLFQSWMWHLDKTSPLGRQIFFPQTLSEGFSWNFNIRMSIKWDSWHARAQGALFIHRLEWQRPTFSNSAASETHQSDGAALGEKKWEKKTHPLLEIH